MALPGWERNLCVHTFSRTSALLPSPTPSRLTSTFLTSVAVQARTLMLAGTTSLSVQGVTTSQTSIERSYGRAYVTSKLCFAFLVNAVSLCNGRPRNVASRERLYIRAMQLLSGYFEIALLKPIILQGL